MTLEKDARKARGRGRTHGAFTRDEAVATYGFVASLKASLRKLIEAKKGHNGQLKLKKGTKSERVHLVQ
jgi:hypothetical protein